MKKCSVVLVFAVGLLLAVPSFAQIDIGVVGGLNIANLSGEEPDGDKIDFSSRMAFGAGVVIDIHLTKCLSFRLKPSYLQTGAKQDMSDEIDNAEAEYKSTYLEIPLLLKYTFNAGDAQPYLLAGPSIGLELDTKVEIKMGSQGVELQGFENMIKSTNLSLMFGAGLNVPMESMNFFIEGRYSLGISDIFEGGTMNIPGAGIQELADADIKTSGIMIMGGFTFPLFGK